MKTSLLTRRFVLAAALVVVAAVFTACGGDDPVKPTTPAVDPPGNLTQKWHVLNNLELAYNKRNIMRYDQLLDANFTFYLAPSDVGQNGLPASWGRAEDVQYSMALFDPNYSGGNRCKSITMDIQFTTTQPWVEVTPGSAPDETWYTTTAFCQFKFEMEPDNTYISNSGAKARFTVRNAGTANAPRWHLVELYDLTYGDSQLRATASSTEPMTWGEVKALYR